MDEIEKAVKEANAYDFIMKLPDVRNFLMVLNKEGMGKNWGEERGTLLPVRYFPQ